MIWQKNWFIQAVTWLGKWGWFDKYIYGKSISIEDFVRNPADELWKAMAIKNIRPISLINYRIYFIREGKAKWFDIKILTPWVTKFSNAWLWFQISLCMKGWLPLPCIMIHFRPTYHRYFQGAIGIAPEMMPTGTYNDIPDNSFDGLLYAKFRFVNDKTSNETTWNPSDQVGWNEGGV